MTKKVIETTNGWYMENEKEKVELDDIVGLVKTYEPTDSVQLKKEAQLSICEKRIIELEKENEQLKQQNQEYQAILQDMGILLTDNEVINLRNEIADKLLKPMFKSNGFDVDIDTADGFTIIPKGDVE